MYLTPSVNCHLILKALRRSKRVFDQHWHLAPWLRLFPQTWFLALTYLMNTLFSLSHTTLCLFLLSFHFSQVSLLCQCLKLVKPWSSFFPFPVLSSSCLLFRWQDPFSRWEHGRRGAVNTQQCAKNRDLKMLKTNIHDDEASLAKPEPLHILLNSKQKLAI